MKIKDSWLPVQMTEVGEVLATTTINGEIVEKGTFIRVLRSDAQYLVGLQPPQFRILKAEEVEELLTAPEADPQEADEAKVKKSK